MPGAVQPCAVEPCAVQPGVPEPVTAVAKQQQICSVTAQRTFDIREKVF